MSRGDEESRFWRLNCGMGRQGRNKEMEVEVEDEVEVDAEVGETDLSLVEGAHARCKWGEVPGQGLARWPL